MKTATIVVATRNRASQLRLALESIRMKNYQNVDILVIDDASTEETVSVLRDYGRFVRTERIERPGGYRRNPSSVLNVGHLLAKTDIVIEQGGEVCHLTDCVTPLVSRCRPGIVALARVHHGDEQQMQKVIQEIEGGRYEFPPTYEPESITTKGKHWKLAFVGLNQTPLYCGQERPVPFLFLGAIHRADFDAVGGYDETRASKNDEDLANRLLANGVRFCFVGNAVAFHLQHGKS